MARSSKVSLSVVRPARHEWARHWCCALSAKSRKMMHTTMDEDDLTMRNSAISHAVYLFKDKSLAETDKGFWPMVHQIYRFMRTGDHNVSLRPDYLYKDPCRADLFAGIERKEPKTEHGFPKDHRAVTGEHGVRFKGGSKDVL